MDKRELKVSEVRKLLRSTKLKKVYIYTRVTYDDGVSVLISKNTAITLFKGMDKKIETTASVRNDVMWIG